MTKNELIQQLELSPEAIEFQVVMDVIEQSYQYHPVAFQNGPDQEGVRNMAGSNEGSCKIFAFGLLNHLDAAQTLACFGQYFRDDVLKNPNGTDHANIRTFMKYGWDELTFAELPLS